jgi:cation diffusion facilitator CzcD-associated flavoprotein CzcO
MDMVKTVERIEPVQTVCALPATAQVVVIGAGLSGICIGIELRKHGIEDFVVLEKAISVGGTWRDNTYPGVACDVPSHLYSYSFEPNPDWSHWYSSGQEIWDYCKHSAAKYGIDAKLKLGVEVVDAVNHDDQWTVTTRDGQTIRCQFMVSALGGLHVPQHPQIEGLESFKGARFHTAQWDHSQNLYGKRVAIIGTGATTAQVLPAIAPIVRDVTVFQRSAAWVFPRYQNEMIPVSRRAQFRRSRIRMRLHRMKLWLKMDSGVLTLRRGSMFGALAKKIALKHLEDSVTDPALRARLTPNYELGCKRRVISDDYLTSFNRPNVHLVTDQIARIEPAGIRDAAGRLHEFDVIVEGTGFKAFDLVDCLNVVGRNGLSLRQAWADHIETHRSMMVPGFPNFFLMFGPNSANGHTSALIWIESQAKYIAQAIGLVGEHKAAAIEPKADVSKQGNDKMQQDMKKMVFSGGCGSYYTDTNDRNIALWPHSAFRWLIEHRKVRESEYVLTK